ncbi:MAG: peptide-methionine (R)-S-oxide reductase MsrB [Rhodospirillaceae bacterium]|nr:peptide-methionine (R)-S-oxide reductase MsrB [Rhodospirillaceae bacterium]
MTDKIIKSDNEWLEQLGPETFAITRQKGTEPAFSGVYCNAKVPGTYVCSGCGAALFGSDTKFDSGSGWPSFWKPAADGRIDEYQDVSRGMIRTEITCSKCDAHLGHVFSDGPKPTGQRYCVNSASLKLKPFGETET